MIDDVRSDGPRHVQLGVDHVRSERLARIAARQLKEEQASQLACLKAPSQTLLVIGAFVAGLALGSACADLFWGWALPCPVDCDAVR